MLASGGGDAARLAAVLRRSPLLTEALQVARGVDAPDWLVNAGAIRDAVWDAAHGLRPPRYEQRRVAEKRWAARWPRMHYVAPAERSG